MATRVEMLRWLRDVAQESILEADAEKRAPLIAQARAIEAELAELGESGAEVRRSGLSEFEKKLAARQSGADVPRRAGR